MITFLKLFGPEHEPYTTHGAQKLAGPGIVQFAAQSSDVHVNYIVDRGVARGFLPDLTRQHFSGDNAFGVAHEEFQKLELAGSEIEELAAAERGVADAVHLKIFQSEHGLLLG